GVFDFHIILKVERVVIVEVGRDCEFLADLTDDTHINLLVELKSAVALLANRNRRVADLLKRTTEVKCNETAWNEFNIAAAEYAIEYGADEYLWSKAASAHGTLPIQRSRACFPIVFQDLSILILFELVEGHARRRAVIEVPDFFVDGIVEA